MKEWAAPADDHERCSRFLADSLLSRDGGFRQPGQPRRLPSGPLANATMGLCDANMGVQDGASH